MMISILLKIVSYSMDLTKKSLTLILSNDLSTLLLGEGRGPDTRERRKSSLFTNWSTSCEHDFVTEYWLYFVSLTLFESDFWNRHENKEASFDLNSYAGKKCSFNEKWL